MPTVGAVIPSGESGERRRRLLVVDDEPIILKMFDTALRRAGFEVDAFESATAARAMLNFRRYDALVTDKNMPDLDGITLSQAARSVNPNLPIVMTTGYATAESSAAILRVVDVLYSKPVALNVLVSGVKGAIEKRGRGAERSAGEPPVIIVSGDARQAFRMARIVRELNRPVEALQSLDELASLHAISGLIVDERCAGGDANRTIWRLLGRHAALKLILVGDDAALATGLGAAARIPSSADDVTAKTAVLTALRRESRAGVYGEAAAV